MKNFRICFVSLLLWIVNAQACVSQSNYRFQHYNTRNGLANDFVWSLGQDSLGFIWAQYYGGLSRFDGYNFKIYKHNPEDTLRSALNFVIGNLTEGPYRNNIWFSEHSHVTDSIILVKHDVKTDGFIKYIVDLDGVQVNRILLDTDDDFIWFLTQGKGLFSYNTKNGEIKNYLNRHSNAEIHQLQNSVTDVMEMGSSILLSTGRGLWIYDKELKSFMRPVCAPSDSLMLYNSFMNVILDSPHRKDIWIKIQRSLVKIDSSFSIVQKFDFPDGVTMSSCGIDKEGVLWFGSGFGTNNGIFRYNPQDSSVIHLKKDPSDFHSLSSDNVNDVLVDTDQNVWVATDRGVSVLRRQNLKFNNTRIRGGSLWANGVYKTRDSEYLIINKSLAEPTSTQFYITPIFSNHLDSINLQPILKQVDGIVMRMYRGKHHFWISTLGSGIIGYPIDPKSGMITSGPQIVLKSDSQNPNTISSNRAINIWEDSHENLWVVTQRNGMDRVNTSIPYGTKGSVFRYGPGSWAYCSFYPEDENSFWILNQRSLDLIHLPAHKQSKPEFEHVFEFRELINTMYKAADGTFFLGTLSALYAASKVEGRYQLNTTPILSNTEVNSILEDRLGRLWIYSDNKIMCYDRQDSIAIVFDEREGIDHFRAIEPAWLNQTTSGVVIVASPDGVTLFDPADFEIDRKRTFPLLTKLEVNNLPVTGKRLLKDIEFISSDISVLDELFIDHEHSNFSVEFSAMEMTAPEKNLYRHKLEGYDRDWIETDYKNRIATYTNLDAGTYTFRVKASNHHGVWSDQERKLTIIVLPPPWKTWWAYTGYGFLVFSLLMLARRIIVQQERLKSNLKLAQVEQEKEHLELEKTKEVDRLKTSFFMNISHEFRTPLTLIKGPVEDLLEEYAKHPKTKERLKLVQRNSNLLLKLINQLLDLAKLESGNLKIEKSEGDLNSFIRAVSNSFLSLSEQKNIQFEVTVPKVSYLALFDKDKIETILINLINNAIKFTIANGKINVLASIENTDHQYAQLILTVKDTGIGIPMDQQHKIFERFHQISESHHEVGTGIGLSLVKELCDLMEGSVVVNSKSGQGSEFVVTLPIELLKSVEFTSEVASSHQLPVSDVPHVTDFVKVEDSTSAKPRILVVEDNSDLRSFIIDSLGDEFYFLEAQNGKQGLDIAFHEIPDMIISDVMMPEMDGISMTGMIKKDTRSSHIPLILLTAKSTVDSKLSGLEQGADDYLTKPFNKDELQLKVRNGITSRIKMREKVRLELLKESPSIEVQSADEKFLIKIKDAIHKRLSDEQLSVESLAEEIGLSRVQLYRKVTALTGVSVNELIRTFRLQKASQLLQQKWGPVSQVAYEVGFSNLSYFSKCFKEQYGMLPSEYSL